MAKFSDASVKAALSPRRVIQRYPFPGAPEIQIGIRPLTDTEADGARLQAVAYCDKRKANLLADPEFLDRAITREVLSRACYDAESSGDEWFFASQDEVGDLDAQTVLALEALYNLQAASLDPYAHVSAEEAEELGKALRDSPNPAVLLSRFDLFTARVSLLSMVRLLLETSPLPSSPTG